MSVKPRIKVSEGAKAGDIIEIKTVIQHVMETGLRRDGSGNLVPRDIIHTFTATFGGQPVFKAEMQSGISANPFIQFYMRATTAGELVLVWEGDKGLKVEEKVPIRLA